jgi:hypothetical protein
MIRIPWFGPDDFLLLTPRWPHLGPVLQTLLLALVYLVPLALVFGLYRYEMRLVPRGRAFALLLLRLVVILVPITLVSLRPVLAHETHEDLPGRVMIAVDLSDSMEIRDPQREPAEKLRLAKALKLAGGLASNAQLDEWINQYETKRPIQWVKPDEFRDDPERRDKEEEARRKAHDEVCNRVDALTRSQVARELLSDEGVRLFRQIAAKHKVELFGFSGDIQESTPPDVEALLHRGAPAKDVKKDKPEEEATSSLARTAATDLKLPLARALERSGGSEGKVLGLLVLTDGQHNTGDSPVDQARHLKDEKIPLYPIALGARQPPADIAVLSVTAPPSAFKDVDVPVKVRFKVSGLKAQDLVVKVHRPGEEDKPLDERTIKHDGKDQEYPPETFSVRMDTEGRQTLVATVRPADKSTKESREENNQQSVLINVADDKSKVLLIDGEARWEFHYLWQALLRDRSMKVDSVVFTQPRLGRVSEEALKEMRNPSLALPRAKDADKDPLNDYDCIILGDVTPEQLPHSDRVRLEKYVADRGGTLVVLAGKRAMPLAFQAQQDEDMQGARDVRDPLVKMLPIEAPQVVAPATGFPVTLTEAGKDVEFLRLEAEGTLEENLHRWASMPRHYWGVVGKAKKGAAVLAYVTGEEEALTPQQRRQQEEEHALMVRSNYGFGRVFYVGLDSTWRWRWRVGDTYHHRFWSQTIRWAASDKPLMTGNQFVRFGTPQGVYSSGEAVKVVVRLSEEIADIPPDLKAQAKIVRKGGGKKETVVAVVPLKQRDFQQRVLEGQLRNLSGGQYHVELDIPAFKDKLAAPPEGGKPGTLKAPFSVTEGESGEMMHLGTNWALLKELAEKNGTGRVYTAEDAEELIGLLGQKAVTRTESDESKLWQWPWILIVVVLLLTAEWVLRKWMGLP